MWVARPRRHPARFRPGFGLVELLVVLLLLSILLGAGAAMLGSSEAARLRSGAERLKACIEQARTSAITRGRPVALALGEARPVGGGACRLGMFELEAEPADGAARGRMLGRWQPLPEGLVFFGGAVDALENVRDTPAVVLEWQGGAERAALRLLVFSPCGGLVFPEGSESVVLTLGSGTHRGDGSVQATQRARRTIRIGRVVARAWNHDT